MPIEDPQKNTQIASESHLTPEEEDAIELELRTLLHQKRLNNDEKGAMTELNDRIATYTESLAGKYGALSRYKLFHIIAGSSIIGFEDKVDRFDFPEPDSVRTFIERL